MKNKTGLQLNLSTLQGVLGLKNPDITCKINEENFVKKFGKHFIELSAGEYSLTVTCDPLMERPIETQMAAITINDNAQTYVTYQVDMFLKSSLKQEKIKPNAPEKQHDKKDWNNAKKISGGLGYTLGRFVSKFIK
jgi:hypothetical protein